jgi:hypothetical protein
MTLFRTTATAAAVSLLLGSTTFAPVSAQQGPNQGGRNQGCIQETAGGGGAGGRQQQGRQEGDQFVAGVVAAAIQNVSVGANALNSSLNGVSLQLVCVNDVLNNNQLQLLSNILNDSPILNESLNDVTILQDFLNGSTLLNGVEVISVDIGTGDVFVIRQ